MTTYKKLRFLNSVSFKDYFNPEKIRLLACVSDYSMVGYARLSNVYELSRLAERNKIDGAFAECGVWKGGCIAIMAYVSDKAGSNRKIWLFDSFEGLPEPTETDGKRAGVYASNKTSGKLSAINRCVGPLDEVKNLFFSILKLNQKNIVIEKGWFQDTLPKAKNRVGHIAILRLDGDWYESTKCCLENLYDNVVSGGYVIIDDYGCWEGCKKAVDEFVEMRKLKIELIMIDHDGAYFQKP